MVCYAVAFFREEMIKGGAKVQLYADSLASLLIVCALVYLMVNLEVLILRQAARRADEARAMAERMNKAQNRFFSSMSHDLRAPVNEILNLNEMILREEISPEVEEDSYDIRSSGKLLLNVINDVLDISRIEAGTLEIVPAEYNVGDMFSDLVGIFWTQARDKGLEFRINIDPEMPACLYGDETRIRQCLVNVMSNAVKYTTEGSVTLSVQPRCNGKELTVVYTVTDTGIGIRKENIPYIFDAYRREDEEMSRSITGTGLGLGIVKRLVDLMGGTISVNSVYRKGSNFVLAIPQKRIGEERIVTREIGQRPTASRNYIPTFTAPEASMLVVDDNRTNLMIVQKMLKKTGVQIDTAQSGTEALQKTLEKAYDLILLEHMMTEMNGFKCLRMIRKQSSGLCNKAKIVAVTANSDNATIAFYASSGFDGYLIKPFDSRTLEQECARLLPRDLVTLTGTADGEEDADSVRVRAYSAKERVRITTDSTSDLPRELLERFHIGIIPYRVSTPRGIFRDGIEIGQESLLAYLDKEGSSAESLPPEKDAYEAFFADALHQADNVIHLSTSGGVTLNGVKEAGEAAEAFENVSVVDSQAVSCGLGLLTLEAADMAGQGGTPEQIVRRLEALRRRIHCGFIVDNLHSLSQSGQISPLLHRLLDTLMMHPVLQMRGGKIHVRAVLFGTRHMVWHRYIRMQLRAWRRIDHRRLLVSYTGLSVEDLEFIRGELDKYFPFEEVIFHKVSPSVTVTCGKNAFGMSFLGKDPKSERTESAY